jgi:hypothetical protein
MQNANCKVIAGHALAVCVLLTATLLAGAQTNGRAGDDEPRTAPAASQQEARKLIAQLGHAQFAEREAATTRLTEMDASIRPLLQEAIKHRDAEIRARARRILVVINDRYLQQRLAAFAADVDDKQHLDLPGWSRYQQIVAVESGDDEERKRKNRLARELFVEMQRAEPRVLGAMESKLENVNELLADRLREVFAAAQLGGASNINSTAAAALVFAASDPQVKIAGDVANLVSSLSFQQPFYAALNGPKGDVYKKLLSAWVMRDTDDPNVLYQNVSTAMNLNLDVGRELAKTALAKGDLPTHVKHQAMSLLGRAGKKEDAALLEPFLKDEGVLGNFNQNGQQDRDVVKVCDFAMAMMINLTGAKPEQFRSGPLRWNQGWNPDLQTLAFRTDEDRKAALAKWNTWWAANKDKLPADAKDEAKSAEKDGAKSTGKGAQEKSEREEKR